MLPYIVLIIYITICAIIFNPKKGNKNKKIFVFLTISGFFILGSFRNYTVGADTNQYYRAFNIIKNNTLSWSVEHLRFEPGFTAFEKLLTIFFDNPQTLLIISNVIIIISVYYFINKNSDNIYFSIMIFIFLNMYFMYLSAMRQALAICIVLVGYTLFYKKGKKIPFIVFVTLASLFHSSALIMLLLVFLPNEKTYSNMHLIFFLAISLIPFFIPNRLFDIVTKYTKYNSYADSIYYKGSEYAGLLSYIISIVILLFTYIFTKDKKKDKLINSFMFIMSINIVFYALASKISIFTRITTYFDIYNIIAIPNVINNVYRTDNKKILIALFTVFLILYWLIISIYRPEWYGCIPYEFYKIGG